MTIEQGIEHADRQSEIIAFIWKKNGLYVGVNKDRKRQNGVSLLLTTVFSYDRLDEKSQKTEKAVSNALVDLAKMEVLIYNKRDLERMLENERHQPSRSITKKRNDPSI